MRDEHEEWMQRPDRYEALVIGDEVRTIGGMLIGSVTRATRYKNNAGFSIADIRVHGTNGVAYHGRLAAAKTLVKLHKVKS